MAYGNSKRTELERKEYGEFYYMQNTVQISKKMLKKLYLSALLWYSYSHYF